MTQPASGNPDTVSCLANCGLTPDDVDFGDPIGTPSDYPKSTLFIGLGAASVINRTRELRIGSHSHFEKGILDFSRTIELPNTYYPSTPPPFEKNAVLQPEGRKRSDLFHKPWRSKGLFQHSMDIFGDWSLYIVSAPGHPDSHINPFCRKSEKGYIYLAGDACHNPRLLPGEKCIAAWSDPAYPNSICCIHSNKEAAERTIATIRATMDQPGGLGNVEVIFAYDASWYREAKKLGRFFPGSL